MRERTSASHACGSTPFILAVYAEHRTMPNGFGKSPSSARACCWSSGRRPGSVRHSLASHSVSRKVSRRSLGWNWARLRCSYGLSFARAASLRGSGHESALYAPLVRTNWQRVLGSARFMAISHSRGRRKARFSQFSAWWRLPGRSGPGRAGRERVQVCRA